MLTRLAASCPYSGIKRHKGAYEVCGVMLPDLTDPPPSDVPPAAQRLKIVGGRG